MQRISISRSDFGFTFGAAALPGLAAVAVLYLLGIIGLGVGVVASGLIALAAAAIALVWARDAAALRQKADAIGTDLPASPRTTHHTPFGRAIARKIDQGHRRGASVLQALEDRAAMAERLIDAMPAPLLVLGPNRQIQHGNLAAEQLLGDRLVGHYLAEVLRSRDLLEGVDRSLPSSAAMDIEFAVSGPVERHLQARIAPLQRNDGSDAALVIVLQDLTPVRRGEQMRVDFIANVSHELRTPLASLAGFIETLQGQARDDAAARERFLGIMADQTSRMGRLVEDLLSLSQIELDEHNRPAGRVDIPTLVDQTLEELEPVARERSVTLIADLPEGLPPVNGDGDQVAQVLRNLIENAIKYGREGGEVRIAAARVGDTVSLTVQDNGEGIPREHLHRLTERFYRVDAARSRRAGGTGLGLAIVKHIVNRHRGRLAITSTPGEGSRFTVFWPVLHTH